MEHPRFPGLALTRRQLLELGAGVAALGWVGTLSPACGGGDVVAPPEPEPVDGATDVAVDPLAPAQDDALFPLGVQAGDMTSSSVVLWTHSADAEKKRLRVWRDSATPGHVRVAFEGEATPVDGAVKVKVEGLGAGWYRYAFYDDAWTKRGPAGRFRTAFAEDDSRPLVIAGLSCANTKKAPFVALEMAATEEEAPDVVCHLGDMSYNDDLETIDEYRAKWRETLSDPGYRKLYAMAGLYATWDDHEIGNNYDPETWAVEQPERLAAAKQTYFEHVAVERLPDDRLWKSRRWGKAAELFVLDSRSERRPSTRTTDDPIYVSKEQLAWLKDAVVDSPCHFKVILTSVPITALTGLWTTADADRWVGYAAQRKDLLDHLTSNDVTGVVFLTGDFHCSFITRVEPEGPASKYWEIAMGPTAAFAPNPIAVLTDAGYIPREENFPTKTFLFGSGTTESTTTLKLDPLNDRIHVRIVDARPPTKGVVLFDDFVR